MRVIIADDHRLMREGTAALLAADPRIEVVGLASGGREAVELAARLAPDVALLDVGMPDIGGVEACAAIRARVPGVEVLMLTVSEDALDVRAALRLGAAGYLLKDIPPRDLVEAVLNAGTGEPIVMASTDAPEDRDAIVLARVLGWKTDRVARHLATTPADVRARIGRGLRTLRPPRDCADGASPARGARAS